MRTTLDLDDGLLKAARRYAAEGGLSLTAVIEQALAGLLAPRVTRGKPYQFRWKTDKGRSAPKVDIADRDQLHDFLDGRP